MTLPNFMIIGSGRSGTTSLYHYLRQHPDIYMSPQKEPNFYALQGTDLRLLKGRGTRGWLKTCSPTRQAYLALFDGVTTEKAVGEASIRYLSVECAPEGIFEDVPHAQLFAILRHPVERAYKTYMGLVLEGRERASSFREALDLEPSRLADHWAFGGYRKGGLYYQQLSRYFSRFNRDQIHVYLFEDFVADPAAVTASILSALGVDTNFVPDTSARHNPAGEISNRLARLVWTRSLPVRTGLRPYLPAVLRDWALPFFTRGGLETPPIPGDIREELSGFYRNDIENLQDLIGRDLSDWLARYAP